MYHFLVNPHSCAATAASASAAALLAVVHTKDMFIINMIGHMSLTVVYAHLLFLLAIMPDKTSLEVETEYWEGAGVLGKTRWVAAIIAWYQSLLLLFRFDCYCRLIFWLTFICIFNI